MAVPTTANMEDATTSTEAAPPGGTDGEPLSSTLPAILVGVCGLLTNAFVIIVIARYPKLRRRLTSVFLLNQSLADLVASVLMVAHYVSRHLSPWSFNVYLDGLNGELYCRLWLTSFPLFSVMLASTFNLVAITVERYMMVVHPIYHKVTFTKKRALIIAACCWVFGVGYHGFWAPYSTRRYGDTCYIFSTWPNVPTAELYAVLTVLFHLFLPVALMGFMYTRIIIVLGKKPSGKSSQSQNVTSRQRNLIKTLLVVVVGFVVCWSLNQMYWFLYNLGYISDPGSTVHTISVTMVYVNCFINPFIYIFKYEEFRQGMRLLVPGHQVGPAASQQTGTGTSTV